MGHGGALRVISVSCRSRGDTTVMKTALVSLRVLGSMSGANARPAASGSTDTAALPIVKAEVVVKKVVRRPPVVRRHVVVHKTVVR